MPEISTQHDMTGADLLDDIVTWFGRYVRVVNDSDLDLLALWAVHTHLVEETYTTPRLQIDSPVPGSGKTTCLEHLHRLCHKPVQMAVISSSALLARMLDKGMRTILIDEADRALSPDKPGIADVLGTINSGYKKGATRPVLVPVQGGGWEEKEMPTFAPVVIAGNNPNLADDVRSRIIRVLLLPDLDGLVEDSDWELIENDADALAQRIELWADQVRDEIRHCRPALPDGITGRFREKWSPLRRVAELAGGRWPGSVDDMATQDRLQHDLDKEDGMIREKPAVLLLRHISQVWEAGEQFMPTSAVVDLLVAEYPDVWGDFSPYGKALTTQRLGRMLSTSYKMNSDQEPTGERRRGYRLAKVVSVMERMGMTPPKQTVQTVRTVPIVRETHGLNGSNGSNGSHERGSGTVRETGHPSGSTTSSGSYERGPVTGQQCHRDPSKPCPACNPSAVTGPGRCAHCGSHTATQGHTEQCPQAATAAA